HVIPNVAPGLGTEAASALVIELELHHRALKSVLIGTRVHQVLTRDDRTGVEHVQRPVEAVTEQQGVSTPLHLFAGRKGVEDLFALQQRANERLVTRGHVVLARQLAKLKRTLERSGGSAGGGCGGSIGA